MTGKVSDRFAAEDDLDKPDSPSANPKPRARGRAIVRTDGEEAEAATIRAADIRDARADWKAKTLPEFANLIDAELDPDPSPE